MKHTPGPWNTYSEEGDRNGVFKHSVCAYDGNIMSETHTCVAEARGDSRERAYANARLIAAAPELYSALERLIHSYRAVLARCPVRDVTETIAEVEAALAKAGEEDR